jgi:hypothetical protein
VVIKACTAEKKSDYISAKICHLQGIVMKHFYLGQRQPPDINTYESININNSLFVFDAEWQRHLVRVELVLLP